MSSFIASSIPHEKLHRLEFLLGDLTGLETLYPPGQSPVQFRAIYSATREECERFIKVDFFCDIPGIGVETFRALITWSENLRKYRLWAFCASQEEPLHMTGDFEEEALVMISDPWPMPWGLQKMRSTFRPLADGGIEYAAELWEPDGYAKYCRVVFNAVTQAAR